MVMHPILKAKKPGQNKSITMNSRRSFIKTGSILASGLSVAPLLNCSTVTVNQQATNSFGIQLWSLRDIIGDNFKSVLADLASYGYDFVESFEGKQGIFWGMSPADCKSYADDIGINLYAAHCNIFEDFEKKAEEAASIGMKYLVCPWLGPKESMDEFRKMADLFNEKGQICKNLGMRFAYHNHDYSFKELEGEIPQKVMMDNTNPDLVDFEMDMYWVVAADENPIEWMEKYPGRFKLAHIKDRSSGPINEGKYESVDLGTGTIDYQDLIPIARKLGLEKLIVEQEFYPNGSSLEAAQSCANYMKSLQL